jgi:hypothetical protein
VVAGACHADGVWLAGDRILYSPREFGPIAVADLQGSARQLGSVELIYGFDGEHLITDQASCSALSVVSQSVLGDDPPLRPVDDLHCPLRYSGARLHLGRHPRFSVIVRCPHGCHGPIVVGAGDWLDGASKEFALHAGGRIRVGVRLPRNSEIVRRARRSRSVTVSVYSFPVWSYQPREDPLNQIYRDDPAAHIRIRLPFGSVRPFGGASSAPRARRAASRSSRARRASDRGRRLCRSRSGRCSSSP